MSTVQWQQLTRDLFPWFHSHSPLWRATWPQAGPWIRRGRGSRSGRRSGHRGEEPGGQHDGSGGGPETHPGPVVLCGALWTTCASAGEVCTFCLLLCGGETGHTSASYGRRWSYSVSDLHASGRTLQTTCASACEVKSPLLPSPVWWRNGLCI